MKQHDRSSDRSLAGRWLFAAVIGITAWRLAIAWLMPVTQDEAYYFDWARTLAWGYFDHPPGVAVLGLGTWLAPGSWLAARLGNLIAATATLLALLLFYRRCGMRAPRDQLVALAIAVTALPVLAGAILTTPDSALALAWVLALHEALAALQGARWRWLTAGLAVGLGLLGKYTMVLIGPVLLWAIVRSDPRALRTPWPYLGGLVALLAFLPHLAWNADNDWLTMRFQFGHGFAVATGPLADSDLPQPLAATNPTTESATEPVPGWMGLAGYLGTQVALLGLLALPLGASLIDRIRRTLIRQGEPAMTTLAPAAGPLLRAAALFPLAFFGLFAWRSDVEANWPVVYLFAAAPLLAVVAQRRWRWVLIAAAVNLSLVSLYAFHGATGALPLPASQARILRETHGFDALADLASRLDAPVFTDRYQTTAMLRFHAPGLAAGQWPGLTRPSEYLRGLQPTAPSLAEICEAGGFWLIARGDPPDLPGFTLSATRALYDCSSTKLQQRPCPKPLHVWRLYRYRVTRQDPCKADRSRPPRSPVKFSGNPSSCSHSQR
jgi:4-amino-4-deoxy-L-arabinose transferase-like glycosyltransferase